MMNTWTGIHIAYACFPLQQYGALKSAWKRGQKPSVDPLLSCEVSSLSTYIQHIFIPCLNTTDLGILSHIFSFYIVNNKA